MKTNQKVNTVEQFKVLQFIQDNFFMDCITLELVDRYSIKLIDANGDGAIFRYENGTVVTV